MAVEVIYILYSYVFDLYFVSLTATTTKNNHGFHQKNNFCLSYYVKIHIYIICTLWTRIQGYHLTQSLMRSWNIYFFLLYIRIVNLLSRREGPRIYQKTETPRTDIPYLSYPRDVFVLAIRCSFFFFAKQRY